MTIRKEVWLGADNTFDLQFISTTVDRVETVVPLTNVTKIEMYLVPDSGPIIAFATSLNEANPTIDWWSPDTEGVATFKLGQLLESMAARPVGYSVEIQLYDAVNTEGLVWFSDRKKELVLSVHEKRVIA